MPLPWCFTNSRLDNKKKDGKGATPAPQTTNNNDNKSDAR